MAELLTRKIKKNSILESLTRKYKNIKISELLNPLNE